jgi:hypothetical protein
VIPEGVKQMITVSINEEYAKILSDFGNLQSEINLAIKRYSIEIIANKIIELQSKNQHYQSKYKTDFVTFFDKIKLDETFISEIENQIDKRWEIDLADWEFSYKGVQDWTEKLQAILLI